MTAFVLSSIAVVFSLWLHASVELLNSNAFTEISTSKHTLYGYNEGMTVACLPLLSDFDEFGSSISNTLAAKLDALAVS